jgi:hypothetical protein
MAVKRMIVICIAWLLSACATERLSTDQLARVAKDWSLSIRASQVIPVYPLTEDLQPGDVFLVQTPVEDQVRIYMDKGFLPLENHLTRLPVDGYSDFYRGWPVIVDGKNAPPRPWQFPDEIGKEAPNFDNAPLVAFPSYGFSVSRSAGLNVAIPVQSVPVGLNLLDSGSATGTITLKDAYTYALPARTVFDSMREWSLANAQYLKQFEPQSVTVNGKAKIQEFYLRVVQRVYLVKTVNVMLLSDRAFGASGSVGVPGKVELLNIGNATEAAKHFDAINKILSNAADPKADKAVSEASGAAPAIAVGGSVRLAMATNRSVSLVETFRRPLVIGYLASDFKILKDGQLDAPVATQTRLQGWPAPATQAIEYKGCDENCWKIRLWRRSSKDNLQKLNKLLQEQTPPIAIADLETGNYPDLRKQVVKTLIEP